MKKNIILLLAICLSFATYAQKAQVKSQEVTATFDQPEFLKNVRTFSYALQGEDKYWNFTPTDASPTLTSVTQPINLSGLEQVEKDGDIQIIVGFLGNQIKTGQGVLNLNGTYNVMILNKENQIITSLIDNVDKQVGYNLEKYPIKTRDDRNIAKARIVTEHVENMLKELEHVFSGSADIKLPFGIFKKTKGGAAETFNTESQPMIEAIIANPTDMVTLDKAIAYWKTQLDVDFGKKMKEKFKNKVIHANLTSAYILKNDLKNANTSHEIVKENVGMFDVWKADFRRALKRFEVVEEFTNPSETPFVLTDNSMYYITIDGGNYTYKEKDSVAFSKIEIDAFIPNVKSGMASLDTYAKPKIQVDGVDGKSFRHFGDGENVIVTTDGTTITFVTYKGAFVPVVKQTDGSMKIYNSNTIVK